MNLQMSKSLKNIMEYDNNKLNLPKKPAPDKSRLPSFNILTAIFNVSKLWHLALIRLSVYTNTNRMALLGYTVVPL